MEENELVSLGDERFVAVANDVGCGYALTQRGGLVVHRNLALFNQLVSLAARHTKRQRHEFVEALG